MSKARSSRHWSTEKRPADGEHVYAVGIGSNKPLGRMRPSDVVSAALRALDAAPLRLIAPSTLIASRPLGPSARTYTNATALVATTLPPHAMLDALQSIERTFHRRRYRRWGARTLDLDLLLWSGGQVSAQRLTVPHAAFRTRSFVLEPLAEIAPEWRDPVSGLSVRQLNARLKRPKAIKV